MKVNLKFCGHCAPRMDMMELLGALKQRLPDIVFQYHSFHEAADVLLILNACQAQCASHPLFSGPTIIVSPNSIDYWPIPSEQLCDELCQRLMALESGK